VVPVSILLPHDLLVVNLSKVGTLDDDDCRTDGVGTVSNEPMCSKSAAFKNPAIFVSC